MGVSAALLGRIDVGVCYTRGAHIVPAIIRKFWGFTRIVILFRFGKLDGHWRIGNPRSHQQRKNKSGNIGSYTVRARVRR